MANKIWMSTVLTRSPLSRALIPTQSLQARRRLFLATSRPRFCSYSPDGRVAAASSSSAKLIRGQNGPGGGRLSSGVTDFVSGHRYSGRVSIGGMGIVRGAAGSGVEVESESKNKDREILVQHLLVGKDDIQLLIELQRQIQGGADFGSLAEEHSTCPSKTGGGMIGWIKVGQTDPAFEEAAFSAPLNKVVRVKTKHGLHLVQVLNERKRHFLEQLPVEQFHERMQDPTFLEESQLIDVREPNEIATAAIQGFEAYPLSEFGKWAPNIADDLDPEKDTYVLCHHGMRSMQAANWLQSQGFQRLYNISGGIHAYATRVDRSIRTY